MRVPENFEDLEVYEGDFAFYFRAFAIGSIVLGFVGAILLQVISLQENIHNVLYPTIPFFAGIVNAIGCMSVSVIFAYLRKTAIINYEILKRLAKDDKEEE